MLKKRTIPIVVVLVAFTVLVAKFALSSTGPAMTEPALAAAPPTTSSPSSPSSPASGALRLIVAPTGNEVRYRVREQLVRVSLPNDAVGKTSNVTGAIAIDTDGAVIPSDSKFTVDLTKLKSDRDRRDGYVQDRLLETEQYPTATLAPIELRGLSAPLPTSGSKTFQLLGNLTVRGMTRPTTWHVTANFNGDRVSGTAWSAFTFADFDLIQPRVPVLLSVADSIRLEYDFNLTPQA